MKRFLGSVAVCSALLPFFVNAAAIAQNNVVPARETTGERDQRMKWWREARFGMFIHWGLYAVPAGTWEGKQIPWLGEWIMNSAKIPVAKYAALAPQFNPTEFNADEVVRLAKDAGMKYIVMTAKHHDGFALYRSEADRFNIYDATPFKREPIAEMAAACKKHGIKFGLYYSQAQDWSHPGGGIYNGQWDNKAQEGDLHRYVQTVAAPQIREIMTRFKPAVLWWDTPVDMSPEDIRALTEPLKEVPGLITNNRLGNGVPGDTDTPEQTIPANGIPGKDWETCMTINETWGYKSYDHDFKSSESLIRNLVDIASKGGNYLLNIGPDAKGIVPAAEVNRLRDIGTWLKANGQSIYTTTASPYKRLPFNGRITRKDGTLFVNVFTWPETDLTLTGIKTPVRDAKVLATGEKLSVTQNADGSVIISRPLRTDAASTAIALRFDTPPTIVEVPILTAPATDGSFVLKALDAEMGGTTVAVEGDNSQGNIGYWTKQEDTVSWNISVPAGRAGEYKASLLYSCEPGSEGSTFVLEVNGVASGVTGTVPKTNGWADYQTLTLSGTLNLPSGKSVVRIKPLTKPGLAVMNLRQMVLTPVGK